jgi:hypothetical protein
MRELKEETLDANIGQEMLSVLAEARRSNGPWFKALLIAANIQAERRAKYSGGDFEEQDPYTNFIRVASSMGITVRRVFRFYIAQKVARIMVSQTDHDDERYQDTLIDLANYSLLAAGWELRSEEDKCQAIQNVVVAELDASE